MNTVIFGSGNGTNAKAILEAEQNNQLGKAKIVGVFSDVPESGILKIADSYSINRQLIELSSPSSRISKNDGKKIIIELSKFSPDLIVLAGFMKVLPKEFIEYYKNMIINIHPSLLPSFKGLHAIERAFEYGVMISGCTVHWVTETIDSGKIITQIPVRKMETDNLEMFSQKIHAAEHVIYPTIIGNISIEFHRT